MSAAFFAHSGKAPGDAWEPVSLHLRRVADRARAFGEPLGLAEVAEVAGLLHDLGKYTELFQWRLAGRERGLDHWSAGAAAALSRYSATGVPVAAVIAGHHVGLPTKSGLRDVLDLPGLDERLRREGRKLTGPDLAPMLGRLAADGLELPASLPDEFPRAALPFMLETRLLFSTLVDADYLATELHFEGQERAAGPALEPERAAALVEARLAELAARSAANPEVQAVRDELATACREAAGSAPGVFTLTAPTGSGKTLAMLLFALRHAARHGLRRVILAIPYLSILEQTAKIYRELFEPTLGPLFVLEHHSLVEPGDDDAAGLTEADASRPVNLLRRQLTENWDAPLVLTTNVQLLESLFAHKPSRCRKLHRLAGSVILFDEVQTLPAGLAVPTLAALSHLASRFATTVVFATATQPAFDHLDERVRKVVAGGWAPRPIVTDEQGLFRLRRYRVAWNYERPTPWGEIATEMAGENQALAIVNLKRHARELGEIVRARAGEDGFFHLSTNLCPAHRASRLEQVRGRLDAGRACRLVATQCIEAGVDVSFPTVFRALGPLEAIAQAAGRCNRHGSDPRPGTVRVFRPEDDKAFPPGGYQQAAEVTLGLLRERRGEIDLDDPRTFHGYYRRLYDLTGNVDAWEKDRKKDGELLPSLARLFAGYDFPTVAETYRLIDAATVNVLVPWDREVHAGLRAELAHGPGLTRSWARRARPHAVALYRSQAKKAGIEHFLEPVRLASGDEAEDWFVYTGPGYDDQLGLLEAEGAWIA